MAESSPFHMEIFGQSQSGRRFLPLCSWKEKWGGREREAGHILLVSHMIHFPCDTFQSPGEEKGGAPGEWGWGREDGLTVAPAQRHPVFPPGRRLRAKGKAEDRYACVPKLLWWFMASSKLLCKGWFWPRRPKETVSEIKSRWRYVLETPRFRGWNLAQRIWYLLFSRPFGDFLLAYMLVRGFWFVTGPEKMPR